MGMDKIVNKSIKPFANKIKGSCLFTSEGSVREEKDGLSARLIGAEIKLIKLITMPASHKFLYFHVICAARVRTSPKSNFTATPLRCCFPRIWKTAPIWTARREQFSQQFVLLPFDR